MDVSGGAHGCVLTPLTCRRRVHTKGIRGDLKARMSSAFSLVKDANERLSAQAARKLLAALRRQVFEPHFEPHEHGYQDVKVRVGACCASCGTCTYRRRSVARSLCASDVAVVWMLTMCWSLRLQTLEADLATFVSSYTAAAKGPGALTEFPEFVKVRSLFVVGI